MLQSFAHAMRGVQEGEQGHEILTLHIQTNIHQNDTKGHISDTRMPNLDSQGLSSLHR